ncbi:MAG: DUF1062 domain-containing protein [Roseiarcus sp.]|jgi:hypothetical protein
MSNVLRVQWTVTPRIAPQPWLACNRCGRPRPFRSSGKIRINANGARIDVWLIYKCLDCENSWKRPLFVRRDIREIDPPLLHALHTNDRDYVRRVAFDVENLRRASDRVEEFAAVDLRKQALSTASEPPARIEIVFAVPTPSCLRVDRLLATELGVSRARMGAMQAADRLALAPHGARMLRRPVRDRMRVAIEISGSGDDLDLRRLTDDPDAR